jgi:hypothetical protein
MHSYHVRNGSRLSLPLRAVKEQAVLRRVASRGKVQRTGSGNNAEEKQVRNGTKALPA